MIASSASAQQETYDWQSWGAVSDTLSAAQVSSRVSLSSPFIKEGSDKVFVNGRQLSRDQYEINYERGTVRVLAPLSAADTVVVEYTRMPFLLNSVYSLRDVEFADLDDPIATPLTPAPDDSRAPLLNPTGDLVFGGVKSVSLSVGSNRGTSLDQSLRVTAEGQLTKSIRVKALLSDDNLPVQPEGNTQELEYLDKVFVEFSGPSARATLGDFAYSNNFSTFSSFRRELEGASGEATFLSTKVGGAAGSSKGVFRSVTFRGQEGLQGPYDLFTEGRLPGQVVIAGTEVLLMDGEPMQRGRNRDYTIDYDRGTVSFTPRRQVTTDSEIAIDFEVTQEQFDRTSMFGTVQSEIMPGGVTFETMVARENDDANRARAFELSEDDRTAIAAAGDDADAAIAGGATFVGVGQGEYVQVPGDSLTGTPNVYAYDDSLGSYDVLFVEVSVGDGDYVLDQITVTGTPVYRFVGAAGGNFKVGRRLPLPQSHSVVTARMRRQGTLEFDFQYNVSDFDANTLSNSDDANNVGVAGAFSLGLRKVPVGLGKLDLVGSVTTLDEDFKSFDKARSWYFYRDWNLEGVPLVGREVLQEVRTSLVRGEDTRAARVDYEFGRLDRPNYEGFKQEARIALGSGGDRNVAGRAFMTDVTGIEQDRTRRYGNLSASFGMVGLVPSASYTAEEFLVASPVLPDSGISYERYLFRLGKRRPKNFAYGVELEQRDTDELADSTDGWVPSRTDRTVRVSMAARGARALQAELEFSHRVQESYRFNNETTSDLARVQGVLRLDRFGFRSNFDYEISQNQFRVQEKQVLFIGEGLGDYNELGEPVGKGRGAYTIIFLPTINTVPTKSVDLTLFSTLKSAVNGAPSVGGPINWLRANVSFEQSLTVQEQTTFQDGYKVYLFFPSVLQRDDATLSGGLSIRQDWSLLDATPNWSLAFRYQRDDEEENRFDPVKENRFFEQNYVRLDRSISRLITANLQMTRELRRRDGKGLITGSGSTYDVNGWKAAVGAGLRFRGGSTIDTEFETRRQEDVESGALETALSLKPRGVWRLSTLLSVFTAYELTSFRIEAPTGVQPFFYSRPGLAQRWSVTPNLRVSKIINVSATYQGRNETSFSGARITEHDFRIETRAFF